MDVQLPGTQGPAYATGALTLAVREGRAVLLPLPSSAKATQRGKQKMSSPLLDTRQAAERLGLARATLAKIRLRGGGPPFVKLGAKVAYAAADLDGWIAALPRHSSTASVTAGHATAPAPMQPSPSVDAVRSKAKNGVVRRRGAPSDGKHKSGQGDD